jgi:hypothetical protein
MYTKPKSFYPDDGERVKIPEKYDGTSLLESLKDDVQSAVPSYDMPPRVADGISQKRDVKISPTSELSEDNETVCEASASPKTDDGFLSSLFGKNPFGGIKSLFGGGDFLSSFGAEELIIIGIILFLLFSKGADKECALILGVLLFIK